MELSISRHSKAAKAIEAAGALLNLLETEVDVYLFRHILSCFNNSVADITLAVGDVIESGKYTNEEMYEFYLRMIELDRLADDESMSLPDFPALEECLRTSLTVLLNHQHRIQLNRDPGVVVYDDSLQSYHALDVAAHLFIANSMHVLIVTEPSSGRKDFLTHDARRRLEMHYAVHPLYHRFEYASTSNAIAAIEEVMAISQSKYLILGQSYNSLRPDPLQAVVDWAAWTSTHRVVLVKQTVPPTPFGQPSSSRKFLLCIKSIDFLEFSFQRILEIIRPNDFVVFLHIFDPSPCKVFSRKESYREVSEFSSGNKERAIFLQEQIKLLISESKIFADIVLQEKSDCFSIGEQILEIALREGADMIVLNRGSSNRVPKECALRAKASSVVLV